MIPSCVLFIWTVLVAMTTVMSEACEPSYIKYTTITGFFLQDDPKTDPSTFDYVRFARTLECLVLLKALSVSAESHKFWIDQPNVRY
jgi:hypothetical protein